MTPKVTTRGLSPSLAQLTFTNLLQRALNPYLNGT